MGGSILQSVWSQGRREERGEERSRRRRRDGRGEWKGKGKGMGEKGAGKRHERRMTEKGGFFRFFIPCDPMMKTAGFPL